MLVHFWLKQFEKKKNNSDKIILNYDTSIHYDFYSARINTGEKEDNHYFLEGFYGGKIRALQYDGSAFSIPTELNPEDLKQEDFSVIHYYKANQFFYNNLKELTLKNSYHKINALFGNSTRKYAQYRFNKKTLFMKDRLDILSIVLNEYFSN